MEIEKIYYSSHFERAFKKLPNNIQKKSIEKEKIFRKNCFNSNIKTHKLRGNLKNYWSFSITNSIRIMFSFNKDSSVDFIDIADHKIYRN